MIVLGTSSSDTILSLQPNAKVADYQIPKIFKIRWVYHSVFWLLYFLFFILVVVLGIYHVYDLTFYFQLILFFPLDIALVYFNFYFLIPRFLSLEKYFYYGLSLTVAILVSSTLHLLLKQAYVYLGSTLFAFTAGFTFANITGAILERFYLVGLTTAIKVAKDWIQARQRMKDRETQFFETELNFLKSQIQPHFFFNTLNNLYSLTLKKSDKAPEVVLKLSELMSYMLYESNSAKVPLNKEISYLENYIELEKLRFGQRLDVSFKIEGQIRQVHIPPLILILFIENSFKHGVNNIVDKIEIEIWLKVENDFLIFMVKNPVPDNYNVTIANGIGLKNARRRLELLYAGTYTLDLVLAEKQYIVSLKIPV